jgi:hypothetical protein
VTGSHSLVSLAPLEREPQHQKLQALSRWGSLDSNVAGSETCSSAEAVRKACSIHECASKSVLIGGGALPRRAGMSWGVIGFTTLVGLRGAVSLILAQILVLDQEQKLLSNRRITAEARRGPTHNHQRKQKQAL